MLEFNIEKMTAAQKKEGATVIETAHRYVLDDLHNPELLKVETQLADRIADYLAEKGFNSSKIILLDETKPEANYETSTEDHWRWRLFIEREVARVADNVPADYVIWRESEYEQAAFRIVDGIKAAIKAQPDNLLQARLSGEDENRVKIGSNKGGKNITLVRTIKTHSDKTAFIPSCPVPDACVYQAKLQQANMAVTILPESFKEQQAEVRSLFAILGESPNVIVIYFNPETSQISQVENWNKESDNLADELRQSFVSVNS